MKQTKRNITIWLSVAMLAVASLTATASMRSPRKSKTAAANTGRCIEVAFDYNRQNGPGSNQYAVWVENEDGEVVKTLFVTSFTTQGRKKGNDKSKRGYSFRPACVPTWVNNAKANQLTDKDIDAFTGATPKDNGTQTFIWDFKDDHGAEVGKGKYTVYLEATLFNNTSVLYKAQFSTDDAKGDLLFTTTRTGEDTTHNSMIANVRGTIK